MRLTGSWTAKKPRVNRHPTPISGSVLICNEGGCFKAGTITPLQTSVLTCKIKPGWPAVRNVKFWTAVVEQIETSSRRGRTSGQIFNTAAMAGIFRDG